MIRYFISYKYLNEDNKLGKKIDICSPEVVILKKYKDGTYRVEPILYFNNYTKDIISCADKITQNKKGISLMIELTEKEAKKYNPLYVKSLKTYDLSNYNILKDIIPKKEVKLINYNIYENMTARELSLGNNHFLVSANAVSNSNNFIFKTLENDREYEERNALIWSALGNDIYFYTDEEEILDKYEDETTIFREEDLDTYKLVSHKIILIDSIPQDRIYDISSTTLDALCRICDNSIPLSVSKNDNDTYNLSYNKPDKNRKKAYFIVNLNLYELLNNSLLVPLYKYINIYELKNGEYLKTNIEEYIKQKDILRHVKKPR